MIRPTVTFWHNLRTSGNAMLNRLQKLLYGSILFVSLLKQKCFERKFLHIFVDVRSLQKCVCVDLL